ncbi:hypothetical protein ASPZODRAFT_132520 [Penicilliopsis zonata CBS 506.65]|uniref:FAD-binding domain-containing protein n=1 Tax=Penicilliopsis zonata CBS 506.65 TaxID=1073090 RepID=A0A1L9SGW6_9EURO|nr:hypothetical protein ASPZODRAFT_132520 [Penicilliopsis zonata CBS 506.65]OJJ46419.1 hypothetical protein ASPZODRAFT_132520 [Penicilliopsis zonata CBS 506.65]
MGLHWGMEPLSQLVPEYILARIQEAQVDPHVPTKETDRVRFLNGQTGELIKEIDSSKFYRLRRDKLRRLLLTDMEDGVEIHWGRTVEGIEYSSDGQTVTCRFAEGGSDTGLALMATDGPHSTLRSLLLLDGVAATTTPIDYAATMCLTRHTREHALFLRSPPHHPLYQAAPHPKGYCAWLSLLDGDDKEHPENWTFFHYISWKEGRDEINPRRTLQEHVAHIKTLGSEFVDPWCSVFAWMPDDCQQVTYAKMHHWDPSLPEHRWDNHQGRVTLAGDAAHPMTPQRGQGLNHAIQDAFTLCQAIQNFWPHRRDPSFMDARHAAISRYEAEMIERTGAEVRLSAQTAVAMHDWSKLMESPSFKRGLHVEQQS